MRKLFKFLFLFFFINLFVQNKVFAYRIPEKEVKEIETFDNEVCLSSGHSLSNEYNIKLYWNCRLNLINNRIKNSKDLKGKNKFYVTELKRIKTVIKNLISRSDLNIDKFEDRKIDNSYKTRVAGKNRYYYNLLVFSKQYYSLEKINNEKEIQEILEARKNKKNNEEKESIRKYLELYPECIRFNINTNEFKQCIDEKIDIEKCKTKVLTKIEEKNIEDKFNCKKDSINKYPDHLALFNSEYLELNNEVVDKFTINRSKDLEKKKRLEELNKLMSGPRLSGSQLVELRKYHEKKCLLDKEIENNFILLNIENECEKIIRNEKLKNNK